jgi:hypothetical protein
VIRNGDKWFAPGVRWADVDISSPDLPRLLVERFEGFYFRPAESLLDRDHDFAAGVLLLSALDALARLLTGISGVGERFRSAAEEIGIDSSSSQQFYDFYRNGLLHEARIKSGACFDQSAVDLLQKIDGEIREPRHLEGCARAFIRIGEDVTRFQVDALPILRNGIEEQ